MKQEIFDECLKHYTNNFNMGENWQSLSEKFSYPSSESLRSAFKRSRRQQGIPSKSNLSNKIGVIASYNLTKTFYFQLQ